MPHLGKILTSYVIDIADFPHIGERKKGKARQDFDVPEGTYVPAVMNNSIILKPVSKFSIHPDCEEHIVTTLCEDTLIVSGDHSLAVLDDETLQVVRKKPSEALGCGIPTMRSLIIDNAIESLSIKKTDQIKGYNFTAETIQLDFSLGNISRKASYKGCMYGSNFSFISPGKKPKFSPASTAGRVRIIRFTSFSFNALTAIATPV